MLLVDVEAVVAGSVPCVVEDVPGVVDRTGQLLEAFSLVGYGGAGDVDCVPIVPSVPVARLEPGAMPRLGKQTGAWNKNMVTAETAIADAGNI